ncbi:hypothetical protein TrVFT333_008295 [Trichoderma virens FT-333]|nr:hypothetical protein TrVFT333_008295 [Trichoderma virens FT-333]
MSEAGSSCDASDRESIALSETGGEMDINHFLISTRGYRGLYLEVGGTVCPGFEIGWVNSLRIRLYHRNILVGEMTCQDQPMMPDSNNYVITEWDESDEPEMRIKSMVGLKNFFGDVLPNSSANNKRDAQKQPTAALRVSSSGHWLAMSIDLANMPRMSATVDEFTTFGDKIEITMTITNPSPLTLRFDGSSEFVLKKGKDIIGELWASFQILPGEKECVFKGIFKPEVSGMVTLEGSNFEDMDRTWQQYVIKLFKVEIDLGPSI